MDYEEKKLQGGPFEEQKLFLELIHDLQAFILEYEKTTISMRTSWDNFLGQKSSVCGLKYGEVLNGGEWQSVKLQISILQEILQTQRKIAKDMESFF